MKFVLKFLLLMTPLMATQLMQSHLDILNDVADEESTYTHRPKTALELDDDKFVAIRRRNSENKILPQFTLDLAQKHIDAQEYILAQYYVKVYLRDYSVYGNLDKAWFLGIESLFLKFKISESQESLLNEILRVGHDFQNTFHESTYRKKVDTILNQSMMIEYDRNEEIAVYYTKMGKPKAAALYRTKNNPYRDIVSKMPRPVEEKQTDFDLLNDDLFE
jgi:hypothetical protein